MLQYHFPGGNEEDVKRYQLYEETLKATNLIFTFLFTIEGILKMAAFGVGVSSEVQILNNCFKIKIRVN